MHSTQMKGGRTFPQDGNNLLSSEMMTIRTPPVNGVLYGFTTYIIGYSSCSTFHIFKKVAPISIITQSLSFLHVYLEV